MKNILTVALLLSGSVTLAQTGKLRTMTGAEATKMLPKITDSKYYDREGHVIDSAKARQMIKSFDYETWGAIPAGQTEYKNVLVKVNHAQQDKKDAGFRLFSRPKNPKLWDGATLDLTPIAKHTDVSKLDGKAIVLLFWNGAPGYKYMYDNINEIVSNYIAGNKFEVFAITHLDYESAKNNQKNNPIMNAYHIVDAGDITDFYDTEHKALIVVTNAQHQITYAAQNAPEMLPRTLNKLLKGL